ncbi:DUF3137 domain-containing protein [Allomuricauda sp. F6463D]|uniref:DUF3137 domain-containing protein n=1 Tax=Allomuricauda sp. F6463D TaxID=2926409 RepID=UPI001FF461E9|nr:DUF3137 domain-containing protein [Muricauda sp. F6463D]MCK0160399.1 DUF3137 domain-containing protein [Muricauda sp. F6463D]
MINFQKIQDELYPLLVKAEHLRKKQIFFQKTFSIMVMALILGVLFLPLITYVSNSVFSRWTAKTMQGGYYGFIQFALVFYWLPFFIFYIGFYSYKNKFKVQERKIMKVALDKMIPEFKFQPFKQISSQQIEDSKLLPSYFQVGKKQNKQSAYNLHYGTLKGKVGDTSISLGDVSIVNQGIQSSFLMYIPLFPHLYMAYNYIRPWFSKHHSIANLGSNFVGMFAVVDFNKNFNGHTVILPDLMEKRVGYLAKNFQSLNFTRGQLVHLEDTEFESDFVVYSTDQVEARYILSTSLMKRITLLKRTMNKPIMLSFNNKKMYLGIRQPHGFLCLNKKENLLTSNVFKKVYEDICAAIDIVEDLNLNTRIWKSESITKKG